MNLKLKKIALAAALTAALVINVSAAGIDGSNVNFRSEASTASSVIGQFDDGTQVEFLAVENSSWYKISVDGVVGFVHADYLDVEEEEIVNAYAESGEKLYGRMNGDYVRVRSGPGTDYTVVGKYNRGELFTITGIDDGWFAVENDELNGYVRADYIKLTGASCEQYSSLAEAVIATAEEYLGIGYVWGGSTPSGFDCSGFVQYVMGLNGISLSRTCYGMYKYDDVTHISKSELQPGDLVFFSSSSESIGHVGIYIGADQFIHSSSGGGCVMVSDLYGSYYVAHYVGAARVM